MSEIPKAYEPQSVEDKWYQFWLANSCFTANEKSSKPAYSIVIPPPNVTGMLHMGHVLNNTIQDILSRKARMDGKEVLWLPGTDHAGIATQVMVEKQLKKEEKKTRHDLGREEFLKRVWVWKEKHGDIIINQLKKLGCSCDWTRERFTMDPDYSRCVQKVFVDLYKKGLIYRGKRMVNWCPATQTALSDEEVEMKPQKGFMYHFKVQVAESPTPIEGNPLEFLERKAGISREALFAAVREALLLAAQKAVGPARELRVDMDDKSGDIKVYAKLIVSDRVVSQHDQISVPDARLLKAEAKVGDEIEKEVTPQGFVRIAATYAKQVLMQKVRQAEKAEDEGAGQIGGPVTDSEGRIWLTIATTRPETIPGDTAVAVNPKDPRYTHLIGKHIVRPLPAELPPEQKLIPIIGDEHVDFEFGTGVLKVTPAHDKADFDIMVRYIRRWLEKNPLKRLSDNATTEERAEFYNLASERDRLLDDLPEVIDERGVMTSRAGVALVGLDRFKARKVAAELLKEQGVFVEEQPHENNVGFSQRADVPIEPRLSEQWFLKYPAVEQSKACVAEGRMKFHPDRWAKVYDHWLTNIQDWCISRQLWWGHRIPVWSGFLNTRNSSDLIPQVEATKLRDWIANCPPNARDRNSYPGVEVSLSGNDGHTTFFRFPNEKFSANVNEGYLITAATISEVEVQKLESLGFTQDPDVLDTWFSSWLWPFATMGWPEQTETLKKFYPTTDLVTGPDIIFFWVARMIMAGYEFMGEPKFGLPDALPFQNVYFTGIIRDKQGRKMSKQLGNSPNPLDLIANYGADALRFGTMRSAPLGQDVLFDEKDVELGRNFCNKLWNACRFRQLVARASGPCVSEAVGSEPQHAGQSPAPLPETYEVQGEIVRTLLTTDDKWILLKLDLAIREVSIALNEYKFSEATAALYRFFWSEYCDWYVEASKAVLNLGRSRGDEAQTQKSEESQTHLISAAAHAQKANTLAVIDFVLSHTLRLFHPFLPFITEELWHGMGYSTDMPDNQGGKTIMTAPWPMPLGNDEKGEWGLDDCYLEMTDTKYDLITQGRNLRRAGNIQAAKKVKYVFKPAQHLTPHDTEVIKLLLNAESLEVNADYQPPKGTPTVQSKMGELFLPLEGHIDPAAEKVRLTKEIEKINAEIAKVEQKLANPNFTQKVPTAVLAEHETRLRDWQTKLAHTQSLLDALG